MEALGQAIRWMVAEGAGWLDDSQAAVVDAYNALVDDSKRIKYNEEYDEEGDDL